MTRLHVLLGRFLVDLGRTTARHGGRPCIRASWTGPPPPDLTVEGTVGVPTVEQRIEDLEAWRRGLRAELERREEKMAECLTAQFQGALKADEQTTDSLFAKLRTYIEGSQQSVWDSYRGPITLGVGVRFGLAANIVSSLPSS
ncbi:hypothetical protein ACQ86D_50550 [Streptomyces galilaeus]